MLFLKNNWKIIVTALCLLAAAGAFIKKRDDNYVVQIEALRKSQQEALAQIDKIRAEEKDKLEKADADHQKVIVEIAARYEKTYKELQLLKKNKEQAILVDRTPSVLAEKLSNSMGFRVQQ
jgi:hypothetical protein